MEWLLVGGECTIEFYCGQGEKKQEPRKRNLRTKKKVELIFRETCRHTYDYTRVLVQRFLIN